MIIHHAQGKPSKTGRGWVGQFCYPRDGSNHIELVRDAEGHPRIYASQEAAERAAFRAMARALNGDAPPPPTGKVFVVKQVGGKSKLRQIAERIFR